MGKIQHRGRSCGVSGGRAALQRKIKCLGYIVFAELPQIEFNHDDRLLFHKSSDCRTRVTDPQREHRQLDTKELDTFLSYKE